jgi:transposase
MITVGVDLHVRNSFMHVEDESGRRLKRGRVGNSLAEVAQFLGEFEQRGEPMRVVLESTTNSRAMLGLLNTYAGAAQVDLTPQVLDARKLRVIAESVSKCDRLDAAVLAQLARSNLKLPVCYMPDDQVFALREHLRARSDLVRIGTMLKNRVHALLHRRGVLLHGGGGGGGGGGDGDGGGHYGRGGPFTRAGRRELAGLALDAAGRAILDRYLAQLDSIGRAVADSTAQLRELSRGQRWCKPLAVLCTMPGVGLITGLSILAELGEIGRFKSRAAVSNWAGLVPVVRDSNHKHFAGHITRRGNAHLRGTMTEAAWQAIRSSRRYGSIYARIGSVKSKQIAIVAVARRMLEDAWMMLRKDQVFRDDECDHSSPQMAATTASAPVAGVIEAPPPPPPPNAAG